MPVETSAFGLLASGYAWKVVERERRIVLEAVIVPPTIVLKDPEVFLWIVGDDCQDDSRSFSFSTSGRLSGDMKSCRLTTTVVQDFYVTAYESLPRMESTRFPVTFGPDLQSQPTCQISSLLVFEAFARPQSGDPTVGDLPASTPFLPVGQLACGP